jgi:cytochrome c oxidase subunit 2
MHSAFDPHSPQARAVAHLWWWMLGVGGAIWAAVVVAMLIAVARRGDAALDARKTAFTVFVAGTAIVLASFLAYDFAVGREAARRGAPALTIAVTGHQWWWEVNYEDARPSQTMVTANEIHVPTGQLIEFKLHAADVIHSFWAPNLNGKRDLIPGYATSQWFVADTPGVYRGQCAEFCGLQHAKMAFYVVAQTPNDYLAWRTASAAPHTPPADSIGMAGLRVFLSSGCPLCHTIAGTDARGTVGPSLSHLASRKTLAAGTLANTRDNLMAWIVNPQAVKPGVHMPALPLQPAQLNAVVTYLETLK